MHAFRVLIGPVTASVLLAACGSAPSAPAVRWRYGGGPWSEAASSPRHRSRTGTAFSFRDIVPSSLCGESSESADATSPSSKPCGARAHPRERELLEKRDLHSDGKRLRRRPCATGQFARFVAEHQCLGRNGLRLMRRAPRNSRSRASVTGQAASALCPAAAANLVASARPAWRSIAVAVAAQQRREGAARPATAATARPGVPAAPLPRYLASRNRQDCVV